MSEHLEMHPVDPPAFLAGGGEMGALIRAFDWPNNPLGPLADWPQSLKTAVSICLDSRFPIPLWWGPDLRLIYNDAWRPVLGRTKHPQALGSPGRDVWPEIWHIIGPMLEGVLATGQATWSDDQLLPLDRNGYLEEAYFTYSYSPIRDEGGKVGGVFSAVNETTLRVIGERRLRTLRELAAQASTAKSPDDAGRAALQTLASNPADVPFALLYFLEADRKHARLCGCRPMSPDTPASPQLIDLSAGGSDEAGWRLAEVVSSGRSRVVDLPARFGPMPRGPLPVDPKQAVVLPLRSAAQDRVAGVLVLGVNPCRALDDEHRSFFDLVTGHVAAAVANASAYEEERRRVQALAELDRAKTAFFSNVSHEFRTPLTLMLGPVEDALADTRHELPPAQRERVEVVHRNGLRLQRLVNALLDFSRIEAGRVRATFEPTDLAAFTADLASNFRSACEKTGLELTVECPPLDQPVFVDRQMYEKVVLNLLSNAFKFTLKGGIAVTLRRVGRSVELGVRDTGTGIPAEEMPKLFERFHRVENAHGRTHEGSGIGLALVQELVKLHGGSITAESEVGSGTTFTVSLPLGADHLPPEQVRRSPATPAPTTATTSFVQEALHWLPQDDAPPEAEPFRYDLDLPLSGGVEGEKPRVLVADDNADMRRYIQRLLSGAYRVETVADGEAALVAVRRERPDLILSDVMMPRLDGFGLLRQLRGDPATATLPVVLLSARAGEESRVEGVRAGADDYLVKPFSARELLVRIAALLQTARLRQEAQAEVRRSEERLRLAVENTGLAWWDMDLRGGPLLWSPTHFTLLGYDPAPDGVASFGAWADRLHPDDRDRVLGAFEDARRRGVLFVQSYRIRRADDGRERWLTAFGRLLADEGGEPIRSVGILYDDTDRRRAEEALRESEERLRAVVETTPACIKVVTADGTLVSMNSAGLAMVEASRLEDVQGECVYGLIRTAYRDAFRRFNERVCRGEAGTLEFEIEGLRGTRRFMETHAAPLRAPDGEFRQLAITYDITERKRAERLLQVSEQWFRLMADAVPVMIWVSDHTKECTWFNKSWLDFTGRPMSELVGNGWAADVHADDLERCLEVYTSSFDARRTFTMDYRLRRKDGEYRWVVDTGIPLSDTDGKFVGYIGSCVDFTDRKLAEEALQEADRRKDEFLATLAHELRNPLAPLRNGLQVLRLGGATGEMADNARTMMERQLGQMVHLIDDLLDLSRISRGKIELRKERLELSKVIQQAIETSRPLIELAGHDFTITMPPGPIYVDADVTRLAQVFSNILNNAAKYTERGGRVQLAVQRRGGEVVVSVKDNGVGIPAHMLPKVFEMFTQVDRSLERSQGGLGIGLSIVKRLVEMHGGSVGVQSDGPGMGSEFVVRLPVVLSVAQPNGGDEEPARPPSGRRVLVVDDNVDAAMSLAMMLKLMGNEAKTAHDGLEALDVAAVHQPDLILLDIGMPRLNGYETAKRIREQPWGKGVALVALTGWGQEEDRRKSEQAGFDAHITKPIEPSALEKLLAELRTTVA